MYCYGCQRWMSPLAGHACLGVGPLSRPQPPPAAPNIRIAPPITEERIREIVREELRRQPQEGRTDD